MSLTPEQVKKIAQLARIKTDPREYDHITEQLNSIMNWIDQLTAVDVTGIDLHKIDEFNMHERQDEINDGQIVESILANAPASQHNMFCVPKVIE